MATIPGSQTSGQRSGAAIQTVSSSRRSAVRSWRPLRSGSSITGDRRDHWQPFRTGQRITDQRSGRSIPAIIAATGDNSPIMAKRPQLDHRRDNRPDGQRPAVRKIRRPTASGQRRPFQTASDPDGDRRDNARQDHRQDRRPDGQTARPPNQETGAAAATDPDQTGTGFFIREFSVLYPGIPIFYPGIPVFFMA